MTNALKLVPKQEHIKGADVGYIASFKYIGEYGTGFTQGGPGPRNPNFRVIHKTPGVYNNYKNALYIKKSTRDVGYFLLSDKELTRSMISKFFKLDVCRYHTGTYDPDTDTVMQVIAVRDCYIDPDLENHWMSGQCEEVQYQPNEHIGVMTALVNAFWRWVGDLACIPYDI